MPIGQENKKADRLFLLYLAIWLLAGLIILMSASGPSGYDKFADSLFFVKRQIIYGILPGLFLFLILARLDYRRYARYGWLIYGLSLLGLVLVFIPGIGLSLNGARSWLAVGGSTFQPSELAKLGVIVMAALMLSDTRRDLSDWRNGLAPVLGILAPAFLLILLQPDLGTLSILVVIVFVMLFLARAPKTYLTILGLGAILVFIAMVYAAPYRLSRLTTFLHPELDPQGVGYHINQAFLAIGSGGLGGLGLNHSRQKFQYLPEVSADSIFAVYAEEMGFFFSVGLVVLILLFASRGLKIAKAAPDEFGRLLAGGIIIWLVWQAFLNIGAMVGVLPLTGVPLPFVSHGGSALMVMLAAAGVVASVSRAR